MNVSNSVLEIVTLVALLFLEGGEGRLRELSGLVPIACPDEQIELGPEFKFDDYESSDDEDIFTGDFGWGPVNFRIG